MIVQSTFGFFNIPKRQLKTNQEIPENNSNPVCREYIFTHY